MIRHLFFNIDLEQVWSKASKVAEAYAIGRSESAAAQNLKVNVDLEVVEALQALVQTLSLKLKRL